MDKDLLELIENLAKISYELKHKPQIFRPGSTHIPVTGKIFGFEVRQLREKGWISSFGENLN